jgi:hypothetical protein
VRLADFQLRKGERFVYEYDFLPNHVPVRHGALGGSSRYRAHLLADHGHQTAPVVREAPVLRLAHENPSWDYSRI